MAQAARPRHVYPVNRAHAPLGKQQLKGLTDELELFAVRSDGDAGGDRVRDPVCGMEMAPTGVAARLAVGGSERGRVLL
jgi:hypothetical protein